MTEAIAILYLLIGVFVSWSIYDEMNTIGVTGDIILSQASSRTRDFFYDHPDVFKFVMVCVLLVVIVIWPYILFVTYNDSNDDDDNELSLQP